MGLLGIFLFMVGISAEASDPCRVPLSAPMQADFEVLRWNPDLGGGNGDWDLDLQFNPCQPNNFPQKVQQALSFLQTFPPSAIRHDDFDRNFLGDSLYVFFESRIRTILLDTEDHSRTCRGSTVAYYGSSEKSKMHICPSLNAFSSLYVSSVLLHEARHFEGFPHEFCDRGYYFAEAACDPSVETGGSYAVEVEFFVRVSRATGFSESVRQEARAAALADLADHFLKAPLGGKSGPVLLGEDGMLSFFDGEKLEELARDIPRETIVSIRDLPVLYSKQDGSMIDMPIHGRSSDTPGKFAQMLRALPEEDRKNVVDIYYGDRPCILYPDRLFCYSSSEAGKTVNLPEGVHAVQFYTLDPVTHLDERVFVLGDDGNGYQIPYSVDLALWTPARFVKYPWLAGLRGLNVSSSFGRLGLSMDGKIVTRDNGEKEWKPIPAFEGKRYSKILGPIFWSPRYKEL